MKRNFKELLTLLSFLLIISTMVISPNELKAYGVIYFGNATYTNGTYTETFALNCGDFKLLPSGGTLTFVVYGSGGDILDNLVLSSGILPAGASFLTVSGILNVQSTFTWTPPSASFSGEVRFFFAPYGIECPINFEWPLPVELSSFTSVINGNNVTLNWQTVSEVNNARFEIEKSSSENIWNKIGTVAGNGNSSIPNSYFYEDRNMNSGKYKYRLKQTDFNGNFEYLNLSNEVNVGVPEKFTLSQNYPNPFNPSTNINFDIPFDAKVNIKIFDMTGREVVTLVNDFRTAGYYSVNFDASSLSSGIYLYSITAGNFTATKKMMLNK